MPVHFMSSKCTARIDALGEFAEARGEAFHRNRLWWIPFLFMAMLFWPADARTQNIKPIWYVPTLALGEGGALGESGINNTSSHPDFVELPDQPPAGVDVPEEVSPSSMKPSVADIHGAVDPLPKPHFQLKSTLLQEFEYLMVQHAFRLIQDPDLRHQLAHNPFFHNWFVSFKGYDLKRWGDGDSFVVNDIGHPLQGAVASRIYLQNSPGGRTLVIGKDPQYWKSRLKGMAWSAGFEVQWKIGPLSETSIGNAGGWEYVPGCGKKPECKNNPNYPPPTNNTGLTDWIISPVVGMGWVMAEDTLDKYVVKKAIEHHRVYGNILLTALEPSRSFAGLFAGKLPWQPITTENHSSSSMSIGTFEKDLSWKMNRNSAGVNFVNINLPGGRSGCTGCRENYQGVGFPYEFRIFKHMYFDSELNYFPAGSSQSIPRLEGLYGAKLGMQTKTWGLFGKVRPGFIYYERAWSGGESAHFTNLTRFAVDAGGALEIYPSNQSTIRIDLGTTLVRYLQDYPNPRISPIGSIISTQYYVNQGNFQFSTGYRIRF